MTIRVTVEDTESGETSSSELENNYVVITGGSCEVANTQVYPTKGIHVITIKTGDDAERVASVQVHVIQGATDQ